MRLLLLLELMVVSASAVQLPGAGSEALAALLAKGLGGTAAQRISSSSEDLSTMLQQIVTKPIARHLGVAVAAAADGDGAAGFTRSELSFPCSGLQCSAWLFMPKQPIGGADKPPVIVMGHGLGGQKSWLQKYAAAFADAGFAVFVFDYRYWGGSEGLPRQWISPRRQLEDWASAISYVQGDLASKVDTSKLSLWGTSFAGGHVITMAARLGSQVKAVVSQVPHLDGPLASSNSMMHRGLLGNALLALAALSDVSGDGKGGEQPVYVPLGGPLGSLAIMQLDESEMAAYNRLSGRRHLEGWNNLTRASLVLDLALQPYSPVSSIKSVQPPTLIVAATKDTLCPYQAAKRAAAASPRVQLYSLECNHFDIYGEPWFGKAVAKQLEFLKQHGV